MGNPFNQADRDLLVNALCDAPPFQTDRERQHFVLTALGGQPYSADLKKSLQWLDWQGSKPVVAGDLIRYVEGRDLAPGLPALRVLVEAIEPIAGIEHQQPMAALKKRMGWIPQPPPGPASGVYDVFLCHNSKDKPEVKRIAELLIERGLRPWLDEWSLQPGLPWQPEIETQFETTKAAAVFLGPHGLGEWQKKEGYAILSRFKNRPVIPVFLPTAPTDAKFTAFLDSATRVDFRKKEPDPVNHLIFGITGRNS